MTVVTSVQNPSQTLVHNIIQEKSESLKLNILSLEDGEWPLCHFYPVEGQRGHQVIALLHSKFYRVLKSQGR